MLVLGFAATLFSLFYLPVVDNSQTVPVQFSTREAEFRVFHRRWQHSISLEMLEEDSLEGCGRFLDEVLVEMRDPYSRHLATILELPDRIQFSSLPGFDGKAVRFNGSATDPFLRKEYTAKMGYRLLPKDPKREDFFGEIYCAQHADPTKDIIVVSFLEGLDLIGPGETGISSSGARAVGLAANVFAYFFVFDEHFLTDDECRVEFAYDEEGRFDYYRPDANRLEEVQRIVGDCRL
ncbi:hypothetical protein [Hoeflea prorocentri]|uniref:Uncharacterized protein n=1 Tax=Hoeflea prorocentri TaxID=1922333 RepID=A0A9X3ULY9_9HYPH|nr:hypothetical protein [Hoeflea prorocentri]MCY6383275.1 hypothetical protein [Hoeflea prorocentri]MDA5401075.1 hypothetical protein [Hoeflea prorocentri]